MRGRAARRATLAGQWSSSDQIVVQPAFHIAEAIEHGSEWEHLQIFDMLESMAAWLRDSAELPSSVETERNRWRLVARVVLAGKVYE